MITITPSYIMMFLALLILQHSVISFLPHVKKNLHSKHFSLCSL